MDQNDGESTPAGTEEMPTTTDTSKEFPLSELECMNTCYEQEECTAYEVFINIEQECVTGVTINGDCMAVEESEINMCRHWYVDSLKGDELDENSNCYIKVTPEVETAAEPPIKNTRKQFIFPGINEIKYPKVRYVKFTVSLDVERRDPKSVKLPFYQAIEDFIDNLNQNAPDGMKNLIQGSNSWIFMPTESMFVQGAIQGIIIAIAFAFIILLIATGNIIQASVSILCVALVIMSILAVFKINGQQFGVMESISVVVLIGFSVDYIVHYSADYIHSREATRDLKMQQAYR